MTARPGQFLCGCDPAHMLELYKKRRYEGGVMEVIKFGDSEIERNVGGVEVCPEHGYPMYGYLSPQVEKEGLGRHIDYGSKGQGQTVKITKNPDIVDRRDLRTTEEVLLERQREKAMMTNGHG